MYTMYDYIIFQYWESGVWWYFYGHTTIVTDDYRSPYQA